MRAASQYSPKMFWLWFQKRSLREPYWFIYDYKGFSYHHSECTHVKRFVWCVCLTRAKKKANKSLRLTMIDPFYGIQTAKQYFLIQNHIWHFKKGQNLKRSYRPKSKGKILKNNDNCIQYLQLVWIPCNKLVFSYLNLLD